MIAVECLNEINCPELICAFRWFIFVFIIENARSKKQNTTYCDTSRLGL